MAETLVYRAIADPTRRRILDLLRKQDGMRASDIAQQFDQITRIAVSKHLQTLREARLVVLASSKDGRERIYQLNPQPLQEIQQWLRSYEEYWQQKLETLKSLAEESTEDD